MRRRSKVDLVGERTRVEYKGGGGMEGRPGGLTIFPTLGIQSPIFEESSPWLFGSLP